MPFADLVAGFRRAAEASPEALAVEAPDGALTYRALAIRARHLAARLIAAGARPDQPLGLCLERTLDLPVAVLAALWSGGACLPLDPSYPAERLTFMLRDSGALLVLGSAALAGRFDVGSARWLSFDELAAARVDSNNMAIPPSKAPSIHPDQLAYVLYTSGSTGRPKGVAMAHQPLVNLLSWQVERSVGGRTLQFAPLSFDVSFQEIFGTWFAGGTLVLVDEGTRRDPSALLTFINERAIERLFVPFVALQWLADEGSPPPALREVVTAGESLRATTAVRRFFGKLFAASLENQYGPTEAHVVTAHRLPADPATWPDLPSIGKAVTGVKIHLADGDFRKADEGELLIGGLAPARGYLGRPAWTAERFVPNPFGDDPGGRLYRTGDRARRSSDGSLEFLGRLDRQLKVRGFRIEPGEIETRLESLPEIRQGAVEERSGSLVAYAVPAAGSAPEAEALLTALAADLPDYMVPSAIVFLDVLPLTASGKVDRAALPAPVGRPYVEPRTNTERAVARVWREVLGGGPMGRDDDFFERGGHSLLGSRVTVRLCAALGVEVPLAQVFERRTVKALAEAIERDGCALADRSLPLAPGVAAGEDDISFAQARLWFIDRLAGGDISYNVPLAVQLPLAVEPPALAAALQRIGRRHEVLRSVLRNAEGRPEWAMIETAFTVVPEVDLRALEPGRAEREAARRVVAEVRRPFDLASGPLARALLLTRPEGRVLNLVQHHAVTDGWSLSLLVDELAAELEGWATAAVPAVQYRDWARWQRRRLAGDERGRLLRRWRQRLAGLEPLELPADRPPAVRPRGAATGAAWRFDLPASLGPRLAERTARQGETPNAVLLAGFLACLARWTGTEDLAVGSPAAGRGEGSEDLLGFFVNTLVLRAEIDLSGSFDGAIARCQRVALEALADQELPFELLVEELAPRREAGANPLVSVLFVLQNLPRPALPLSPLGDLAEDSLPAKADLVFEVEERSGPGEASYRARLEYRPERFDGTTIQRLGGQLGRFLEAALAAPDRAIEDLPLLSAAERHQLLREFGEVGLQDDTGDRSPLSEVFLARGRLRPDSISLIGASEAGSTGEQWFSFGELDQRTEALAHDLRERGVGAESVVALMLPRTPRWVMAAIAVMRAGGTFVPVDLEYPQDRVSWMLEDSGARWIVTDDAQPPEVALDPAARVMTFDQWMASAERLRAEDQRGERLPRLPDGPPEAVAYMVYTSGSTGRPKGVMVTHQGFASLAAAKRRVFDLAAGSVVVQLNSPSFDGSILELLLGLAQGSAMAFPSADERLPGPLLAGFIERCQATHLFVAPSALLAMEPTGLEALSTVLSGGEEFPPEVKRRWAAPGRRVFNAYGPTETTVCATFQYVEGRGGGRPPIGEPVAGLVARVLDRHGSLVGLGMDGELYLGGPGLARGYHRRAGKTAAAFVPDGTGHGERLYRTGDLVRWRRDGKLEYRGRIDHQVKLRGFRIELGEIEAALTAHAEVTEAAAGMIAGPAGDRRLGAWVVPAEPEFDEAKLRHRLREDLGRRLPTWMVPATFAFADHLPRTPSGKLDRRALPAPEDRGSGDHGRGGGARSATEATLIALWQDLLGARGLGVEDDFFELGGHSLLATRLLARVERDLGVEIPVARLFDGPTVAALAAAVDAVSGTEAIPLARRPRGLDPPASAGQRRLWFLERLRPGDPAYNIPLSLIFDGALDPVALAAALDEITRRHEVLRTVLAEVDGLPVQRVQPATGVPLPLVSLTALPRAIGSAEGARLARREAARPFDLARGPLQRSILLRESAHHHRLLVTQHHAVSDAVSIHIFLDELATLYRVAVEEQPSPLAEPALQFGDWSWSEARPEREEDLAWWRSRLAEHQPADLPLDRPRPSVADPAAGCVEEALPAVVVEGLEGLARRSGATLFMVALAVFSALLQRLTGRSRPLLGTPVAGRDRPELESLIGFFVNTLVLRPAESEVVGLDRIPRSEWLRRVREGFLAAYGRRRVPFDRLVEELAPDRDLARSPLIQVMFALRGADPTADFGSGLAGRLSTLENGREKFDLTVALGDANGGLSGRWTYRRDLFDATTVRRWARAFGAFAEAFVVRPDAPLSELSMLDRAQRQQLVYEWNDSRRALAASTLDRLFARQVGERPDAIALEDGDLALSYCTLDRRSAALAAELHRRGLSPEGRVALLLDRSADLIVAILAVTRAGGVFLPLDGDHPPAMLEYFLRDAEAPLMVSDRWPEWVPAAVTVIPPRGPGEAAGGGSMAPLLAPPLSPDSALYVMYTSGSTGRPKGVMATHRGVDRLVRRNPAYDLHSGHRIAQASNASFDASTFEIWGALLNGGTLVIVPKDVILSPARLGAELARRQITGMFLTTALFHEVARAEPQAFTDVEYMITGGEGLDPDAARQAAPYPQNLLNAYGPTEATTFATTLELPAGEDDSPLFEGAAVAIGRPIADTDLWVVDRFGRLAPPGVAGELWIGGAGLARGYLGRPRRTAERWVPHPFGGRGERLYRTGDLVYRRADGILQFVGRTDHQVKIRGFRIEPGEVRAALLRHPQVSEAEVLVIDGEDGHRLAACTVGEKVGLVAGSDPDLATFLAERLPRYMVPSAFVPCDAFPITPNGKVDRIELGHRANQALARQRDRRSRSLLEPRNPREEIVAELWAEVLGLGRVGVDQSFFELGGHSLLATQLVARLRDRLGVDLPLSRLFDGPTVAAVVRWLESGADAPPPDAPRRDDHGGPAPLSFSQRRLWFLDRVDRASTAYNLPAAMDFDGGIDEGRLFTALGEIVCRHDSLRTAFSPRGEAIEHAAAGFAPDRAIVDLAALPAPRRPAETARLSADEAFRPFDLAAGRVARFRWLRLPRGGGRLLAVFHHAVSDGWSVGLFFRELMALYRGDALPALPLRYADYSRWQNRRLDGPALDRLAADYGPHVAGVPLLDLPLDRPRPAVRDDRAAWLSFEIEGEPLAALRQVARQRGATLFVALLASFGALLARWAGQPDLLVGTPEVGRDHPDLEGLIGFFVNTLALRIEGALDGTYEELLDRTRDHFLAAHDARELPFDRLVEERVPERDASRTPLVEAGFTLSTALSPVTLGQQAGTPVRLEARRAKFDLTGSLEVGPSDGGARAILEYAAALFERTTIERLAAAWRRLLAAVADEPGRRLAAMPWLSAPERHQVLFEWAHGGPPAARRKGSSTVVDDVLRVAAEAPDRIALEFDDRAVSFGELDARSAVLGACLRSAGVRRGQVVATLLDRSPALIISWLAAWRIGAAYLPIDPALPPRRTAFLLEDSGAEVVCVRNPEAAPAGWGGKTVAVAAGQPPSGRADALPTGDDLAYLVYTSGSTGRPKGVLVPHRGLRRLTDWHASTFCPEPLAAGSARRVSWTAGLGFDAAAWELWSGLANGSTVCLPSAAELPALCAWIYERRLDHALLTTPLAEAFMAEGGWPEDMALRILFTGGDLLHQAPPEGAPFELVNFYGPTECTVIATASRVHPSEQGVPSIGRPIANLSTRVVDRHLDPVPLGSAGELALGGALAWGYLGRPGRTADAFRPDPHGDRPGSRLYRSGDRARWDSDGRVRFLGRLDRQVQVRGVRLELGEVESLLAEHPVVDEVVLVVRDQPARLVAFVTPAEVPDLIPWLGERLPAAALPAQIVALPKLPLTANGKVDRRDLERRPVALAEAGRHAPVSPHEEIVLGFWRELLGREDLSVEDDFFALGGHSLLATRLTARIEAAFGHSLSLARFFEAPTVAAIARRLEVAELVGETPPPIRPVDRSRPLRLSYSQLRMWFIDRLEPASAAYNMPLALDLEGPLEIPALLGTLDELNRRHESLRTVFQVAPSEGAEVAAGGADGAEEPVQSILPVAPVRPAQVDLSALPTARRAPEVRRLASRAARWPFDLERGPLTRFVLATSAPDRNLLLLVQHHAVSDGWSTGILLRELQALYGAAITDRRSPLPDLPVQFVDFAAWQRRWLEGGAHERQMAFWRHTLAGVERLELPTDRPRPAVRTTRGSVYRFRVDDGTGAALHRTARRLGATPFMVLLAAFESLLSRWTGRRDLTVGTPVAGRRRPESEALIGFFVNTLTLRAHLTGDPSLEEQIARVRDHSLRAFSHQDVPFERLVEELAPDRDLAYTPLFQVMFILQNLPIGRTRLGPAQVTLVPLDLTTSKFDLTLALRDPDDSLAGHWAYRTDLFDETTIRRFAEQYLTLLASALAEPERPFSRWTLLRRSEIQQVRLEWNDPPICCPPAASAWAMVRQAAKASPDAVAVSDAAGGHLSYRALVERATTLATRLHRSGVGPEGRVAVCLERSLETVVSLLAVTAVGGAWVPMDPSYPPERLRAMATDAGARWAIGRRRPLLPAARWFNPRRTSSRSDAASLPQPLSEAAAYVIYTSGSTGRPKGVMVSHRSLAHRLAYARQADFASGDVFLQKTSISFDVSVLEIFGPLVAGGRVFLARPGSEQDPEELVRRMAEEGITQASFPPTLLEVLCEDPRFGDLPALHTVVTGGETVAPDLPGRVRTRLPAARVLNRYGPTETTVSVTSWQCSGAASSRPLPIGRPVADARIHLLDRSLEPVPIGIAGEIFLAGEVVARGYLHRPAATAAAFLPDPWGPAGSRFYRTGDLARYRPDGAVEFAGRVDRQVKVRGFRVEPGEIESALRRDPRVREAAVVDLPDGPSRKLVAYWVADGTPDDRGDGEAGGDALADGLRRTLPGHMIPAAFVRLPALPLSPTGKIDRQALAAQGAPTAKVETEETPRTDLEERLAALWGDLLAVEEVGVRDSFFALGGHSLLAVRLARRLEEEMGQRIPLATLFQNPTIERLAKIFEAAADEGEDRRKDAAAHGLVTLRGTGRGLPSFWVHPVGGTVACYGPLANRLPGPSAAFQAPGVDGGEAPLSEIPSLAEHHLAAMPAASAPLVLGGWSFGGVVAFEMARRMAATGRSPERLVLIDAQLPARRRAVRRGRLWHTFLVDLRFSKGDVRAMAEKVGDLVALAELGGPSAAELEPLWRVFQAHAEALYGYRPGSYDGPVDLILPTETSNEGGRSPQRWRRWAPDLRLHRVPGDHYSMLRSDGLAAELRAICEGSRRAPAAGSGR
ncbi:MAG: amino acid adenylation domain-containing protein [Acidobacteriota bacterium]